MQIISRNKIRKQPRRSSRKQSRPYFKNPLIEQNIFLPTQIKKNIIRTDYLCLRNLQELIPQPANLQSQLLEQMKKAVVEQQKKISMFSSKQTTARRFSQSGEHIWSQNHIQQPLQLFSHEQVKFNSHIDIEMFFQE